VAVALTPGKVVYRNRLIELIQYEPATKTVYTEPVLIVPSWIMKYYILDMSPENSMVKYLVDQGHTVFMISWNTPARPIATWAWTTTSTRACSPRCAWCPSCCPAWACTAWAIASAARSSPWRRQRSARRAESPLKTLAMLAAQVDFQEPGELGLFIDDSQVAFIEDLMMERGYLDGRQMPAPSR